MKRREELMQRVCAGFRAAYGEEPQAIFAAPGRVNLMGEHTDYNDGLVLPCAIDRDTMIAAGPGEAETIESAALDLGGVRDAFSFAGPITQSQDEWTNHIRGVAHFLQQRAVALEPVRLAVAGNVPIGAGLSSSASLGVVSALALSSLAQQPQPPEFLARTAQLAENRFVGTQCGIMDQMASACANDRHALMLDCRDLAHNHIAMPDDLALIIIDSGIRHSLGESPYNERRAQCEAAARHYGAATLRDVSYDQLVSERGHLGDVEFARARHIVTDIARVKLLADAMSSGVRASISNLMAESFRSYRDDFEASVPEIDRLFVQVSEVLGDQGGVRLTGGGFGGSLVALAPPELVPDITRAASPAKVGVFEASEGARQLG